MPKTKEELIKKFHKYIKEFGDILTTDGTVLYCKACNKVINRSYKKFSITQHFSTQTHIEAVDKYYNNINKSQIQLMDWKPIDVKDNEISLIEANHKLYDNISTNAGNLQITPIMPKRKEKLTLKQKIDNYIQEFGDVLTTDGNILFCRACNREITRAFKKYSVTQHFNTNSHNEAFKRFVECGQQFLICDQIKTETNDSYVENNENTIVIEEVNENSSASEVNDSNDSNSSHSSPDIPCILDNNSLIDNDLSNNTVVENDIKSQEKIISLLESIKDKVKLLLIDCKCEHNLGLKSDIKHLINEYDFNYLNKNEDKLDLHNESLAQIKANISSEQQLKTYLTDFKKEFVFGNELFASKVMNLEPIVSNSGLIISQNSSKIESQTNLNLIKTKKLKPFKCNKCGKCFSSKRDVKSHIIIVHRNYDNTFSNNSSEIKSNINLKLNKHLLKNKRLKCDSPECNFQTKYNFEMKIHRISVHQNSAQKQTDISQKPIAEDNKEVPEEAKQLKCQISDCGEEFSNNDDLKAHNLSKHQKKMACEWPGCRSEATSLEDMKNHFKTHTESKPYKCEWPACQFTAEELSLITNHKSTHVKVLKRFDCQWPECRKQFFTANRLKLHLMVHKGERPLFKCQFWPKCQKTFLDRSELMSHFSAYHKSCDQ